MKAIQIIDNYYSFGIDSVGIEKLCELVKESLLLTDRFSVNDILECTDQPLYKTQIPFFNGFIEERFIYNHTDTILNYMYMNLNRANVYSDLFCEYTCWDFYSNNTLVLSVNIVLDIISINSMLIDLGKYGYENI